MEPKGLSGGVRCHHPVFSVDGAHARRVGPRQCLAQFNLGIAYAEAGGVPKWSRCRIRALPPVG